MSSPIPRRSFLASTLTVAACAGTAPAIVKAQALRRPRILLRSSWQSVNIGDIGHTPGALSLLRKHFPDADVTLWPNGLGHGSRDLLTQGYPGLRFAEGSVDGEGKPTTKALAEAWATSDLYLSGSGSGFPASNHAVAFAKATGKAVGVFGVSTDPISGIGDGREPEGGTLEQLRAKAAALPTNHLPDSLRYVMDRAAFFFCRDTVSRDYLRGQGVKTPILEFGPDAQLGMHLRDDARGLAYLKAAGLEEGRFVCVIPRLRYTPYYRINQVPRVPADDIKDAINARTTEQDHAKLREMMVAYIRQTGNRVLACPEMTYQVEMAKEVLVDPLPADVKPNVEWLDRFWLPDEAAAVYARAAAVVSVECHSPLIAYRNGTPAFYVRQPTDTCKGQMYRDFGAAEWFFEIEETSGEALWERLQAVVSRPDRAKGQVRAIMQTVEGLQERMVGAVRAAATRRAE